MVTAYFDIINRQYPHFLYVRASDTEATQDDNGSWQDGGAAWRFHSVCREETNGKGQKVNAADGLFVVYASLVHLPAGATFVAEGVEAVVADRELDPDELTDKALTNAKADGTVRIKGECLKFDKGRLHCRLWL